MLILGSLFRLSLSVVIELVEKIVVILRLTIIPTGYRRLFILFTSP